MRKSLSSILTIQILALLSLPFAGSHAVFNPEDVFWGTGFDSLGTNSRVMAIAAGSDAVYAGGDFTQAGSTVVNGIAMWDGSTWSPLGTGVSGFVSEIAASGSTVYIGGHFQSVGGVPASRIAKWDGMSWNRLGDGLTDPHTTPAVFGIEIVGDSIYVGGSFTTAGGITVNGIAMWDGSTWSDVGGGLSSASGYPRAEAMEIWNGDLYVGGNFDHAGGVPVDDFAKWDGGSWSPVTIFRGSMAALEADGDDLYVAGEFNFQSGAGPVLNIAKWDGSSWSTLNGGANGVVKDIAVAADGIYIGGEFTEVGGVPAKNVAKWDGVSWTPAGSGVRWSFDYTSRVDAMEIDSTGALYVGGNFNRAGYLTSNFIAKWHHPPEGAPDISITPGSLTDSLLAGEAEMHTITISNSGGIDLMWRMATVRDLAGDLSGVHIMWSRSHGQDAPTDFTTTIALLTANGAVVTEESGALTPELLDDYEIFWSIDMTSAWSPADITVLSDWVSAGGNLLLTADAQPALDSFNDLLSVLNVGIEYTITTPNVSFYATDIFPHIVTSGVDSIYYYSTGAYLSKAVLPAGILLNYPTVSCAAAYAAIGKGRIIALGDETLSNPDVTGAGADNLLFGLNAVEWLAGGVIWAGAAPAWGVVPAGESTEVMITLDAGSLTDGDFYAEVEAYSNDYSEPVLSIPVTLHVTGTADIALSDTTLDFGAVYIETTAIDTLTVLNVGTDTLTVSDLSVDHADYGVQPSAFDLPPGDGQAVEVTLTPSSLGIITGTITIISSDPDEDTVFVNVFGEGVEPPVIDVHPDSLSMVLYTGQISTRNLTIENTGGSPLHWQLLDPDSAWLSAEPDSGTVPAQESRITIVEFDASDLDGGEYQDALRIVSNAGNDSIVTVPVNLQVLPLSDIMLSDLLLDYEPIYLDQSVHKILTIYNLGNDTLRINRLSIDNASFLVDTTLFDVAPDDSSELTVTFSPLVEGFIEGTLTIESNDIDEGFVDVSLEGTGLLPPDIVAAPDSIAEALLPDEAAVRSVTVMNPGATDLHFVVYAASAPDGDPAFARSHAVSDRGSGALQTSPDEKHSVSRSMPGTRPDRELKPYETGRPHADFAPQAAVADVPSTLPLIENFEQGSFGEWQDGGGPNGKQFTVLAAANGTIFSHYEFNFASGHYNGIYREMGSIQPHYIGFWVRPGNTEMFDSYFVVRDGAGREVIWFFANADGTFYINEDVGGHGSYAYVAKRWYHVEFTDIDYEAKTFDYHVNHELIQEDISFRNASQVEDLFRLDLYNYSVLAEAWWDEIYIADWMPLDWLTVAPRTDNLSPDSSGTITLLFDAGGLDIGSYDGFLQFQTNVPGKYLLSLPVHLDVDSLLTRALTFHLNQGWNLISWNVDTQENPVELLLSAIVPNMIVAHGFDEGGLTFDPSIPPEFNTLGAVGHPDGCWIKMNAADTLVIEGRAVLPQTAIPLDAGYNLISYLPNLADSVGHALASVLGNTELALGFDGTVLSYDPLIDPGLNTLQFLEPRRGYWLKAAAEDTLVYPKFSSLPPPGAAHGNANAPAEDPPAVARTAQDSPTVTPTSEWISVWGDSVEWAGEPVGGGTVITAVDEDGVPCGTFTVTQSGRFGCMAIYRNDPYTMEDEGADPGEMVRLLFNGAPHSKCVTWTENGDVIDFDAVTTGTEDEQIFVPSRYDLSQNYPNPFNPWTTIQYDLPEAAQVRLSIYNVKGELVRRLVDCRQPAGRHHVRWDARSQNGQPTASGVYFYRLITKNFQQTKKMVLLR